MEKDKTRLFFFDNIRWVMIIFVVLMHLNVTYSGAGLWYYLELGKAGLEGLLFGIYGSWTQAYFMGLLFFIAGFFAPPSLDKRGIKGFIQERFLRLGIPTLVYMLIIHPITMFIFYGFNQTLPQNPFSWYVEFITSLTFLSSSGPLWFALGLLVLSIGYALICHLASDGKSDNAITPTHGKIFLLILAISLFAFVTRIFIPAGKPLLNTLTGNFMQLGFFPSYITLFAVGILTYRRDILSKMPYSFGRFWFWAAFIIGIPLWFGVLIGTGVTKDPSRFPWLFGGLHWQSAAYSFWESFFCVAMSTGLIAIFRKKFNTQGRLALFLKDNAFSVYVFHAPILVAMTMALKGITLNPVLKMYTVALILIPLCFVVANLMRKINIIRKYFS